MKALMLENVTHNGNHYKKGSHCADKEAAKLFVSKGYARELEEPKKPEPKEEKLPKEKAK